MNIEKAKNKAKTKAKEKVAKKRSKTVARHAKACAFAALLAACGCQLTPSRSQTLTLRDCSVYIYSTGADTNQVASIEIGTQAMSIENSGTETFTPAQTTDIKPDVDVSVGATNGSGLLDAVATKLINGTVSDENASKTEE